MGFSNALREIVCPGEADGLAFEYIGNQGVTPCSGWEAIRKQDQAIRKQDSTLSSPQTKRGVGLALAVLCGDVVQSWWHLSAAKGK